MDELLKNPFALLIIGAAASWSVQKVLGYLADPSKAKIEALVKALDNNTRAMESIRDMVHDLQSRVMVLEDFKDRHDKEA